MKGALIKGLAEAWAQIVAAHGDERIYAFGLYTTDVVDYLAVTASSETGLEAATAQYLTRAPGRERALQRASLRWSPCDSPLHCEADACLEAASALRDAGPDPYEDSEESDAFIEMVLHAGVEALRELDQAGTFGDGDARLQVTIGIWKGDQSDEEQISLVRKLNPRPVADRFAAERADGTNAFFALSRA